MAQRTRNEKQSSCQFGGKRGFPHQFCLCPIEIWPILARKARQNALFRDFSLTFLTPLSSRTAAYVPMDRGAD
jgi:hypothetical protein